MNLQSDDPTGAGSPRCAGGHTSRWWCAGVLSLLAVSCMEPARERALEDERVGHEVRPGVSFDESQGAAVVRRLEVDRVELWASAPRLEMAWCWTQEPPSAATLSVRNVIPGSAVSIAVGRAEVSSSTSAVDDVEAGASSGPELSTRVDVALGSIEAPSGCLSLRLTPPRAGEATPFRFAVLSDIQRALDRVQDVFRVVNQQEGVDFLLGAGDLTSQGTSDELEQFQRELQGLAVPYYTTLGNHELGTSHTNYHRYFGRGSQSFSYRGVRFTLLDSASAMIDPLVEDRLADWLSLGMDDAHVVAMHIAPLDPIGVRNGAFARRAEGAKLLAQLAQGEVDLTLYGHVHSYYHFENAGIDAHISGGGGAIPERFDDIGRHFLLVDAEAASQDFSVAVVRVD